MNNHDSLLNGFALVHFPAKVIAFAEHKYIQPWDFHRVPRIDLPRGFLLRCPELWRSKNDLSAQLQIHLIGFKPNLSHFSFLKSLHKKHVFRIFWGLSGRKRRKFYKRLCTRVSLQNAVHDKSHPETRTSRIESVLCG